MTLVVKSDNEMNNTKAKLTHKKQSKNKLAASNSAKNLVNIQPKPSPPFIIPCQPPFIYPSSNTAAVAAAQQQLFSLQLLMSSPYFAQALAAINNNNNQNANANNKNSGVTTSSNPDTAATTSTATTTATIAATSDSSNGNIVNASNLTNVKVTGTTNTTISNPVPMPSTNNSATNTKLASSAPSLPTNTLPFLPPNLSLPYLAAALSSLTNQQLLNNKKTNGVSTAGNTTATATPSTAPPATNAKTNSKNAKVQPKTTLNPSLFPKTDNAAAANAALLLNNSLLSNQFLQFLQQQQQQQKNKPLMVNPFVVPTTSSSAIPIASNAQNKSNAVNISSSFPSSSKVKSKISSSSLLINKSKNSKLSTSPNIKSKIPIKKDPLTISKNHRRTSISQSYDPKNPMNNSLFSMMSNSNNNSNTITTNKLGSNPIVIKRENDHSNDPVHHGSNSPDSLVSTSPTTTMATSPLLPISIPFSNLNLRSNTASSPVMESNSLSTLCTIASQEAKIYIPESKSIEKKNMFATLPSVIKEEEGENKMDTTSTTIEETNIFSKLNTTKRNAPTSSLLTRNIQNSKIKDEKASLESSTVEKAKNVVMDEDKKADNGMEVPSSMAIPLSIPMPIAPMSLPTITINSGENSRDKPLIQQQSFNPSSSVNSPLNLIPSSPQSPASSTASSSPNIYHNSIHSVPHSALQRRKSRSMNCSKDYVCELCKPNKRFVQLAHLRIHQRKHTGERPFVCSFCNKSFAQLGNLKTHQRKHTGERPFSCPICFKTFTQSGNLKAHELLHQGVRPFICEWCDKTFTQSGNLKTHQLKMHPELVQNGDESSISMKSSMSSNHPTPLPPSSTTTPSTIEDQEDHMMIDPLNEEGSIPGTEEEEEEQMMMIDEDDHESLPSNSKPGHHSLLEMDNDDYDEIQPMESGVVRPVSAASENDPGFGHSSSQNQDEEEDEGVNFDEEEDFERSNKLNSVLDYEGNNNDFNNPPEDNLKERQLLKRLKALLKRN